MKSICMFLVFFFSTSSTVVSFSKNISNCLYLSEQAPIARTKNKIYLILNNAVIHNECRRQQLIKNVEKTIMNGITILHKPTEDISHINIINEFNTSLFKKHIQRDEKIPVIANPVTAQFEKVSLSVFSETVNNICNLKIKLTKSKNKKITLLSQTSISKYEFCLNSATIFAGSDVKLQYLNGVFNEVVKK